MTSALLVKRPFDGCVESVFTRATQRFVAVCVMSSYSDAVIQDQVHSLHTGRHPNKLQPEVDTPA